MEQQRDLEQLVNLKEDTESNNESGNVAPGPNCRGLLHWRPATKFLGLVVMVFCLAFLVFWMSGSSLLTSKQMQIQQEISGNINIHGGTQNDYSKTNNCYQCTVSAQKSQKHQEIADAPADDQLCQITKKIPLPVAGSSQWKKRAAGGGMYCGPLMDELPKAKTVGHAWLSDGTQYVGPWKHGEPDSDCQVLPHGNKVQCHGGKGTFYYADGKKKYGYWHGTVFCSDEAAVSRNPQCITDWGLWRTLDSNDNEIESIAFHDKHLATGGRDKKVRVYSIEDWKLLTTLHDAKGGITSVALSEYELAAGGLDKKVRVYYEKDVLRKHTFVKDWKLTQTLEDAKGKITSVAFAFYSSYLAAGGSDKKVRIYHKEHLSDDFKLVQTLEDAKEEITSVAFSPKNFHRNYYLAVAANGDDDNKIHIYARGVTEKEWRLAQTLEPDGKWGYGAHSLVFNDKYLAAAYTSKIRFFSYEDWKLVKTLEEGDPCGIQSVALNDKFLAVGIFEGKVRTFSIKDWKLLKTLDYGNTYIQSVALNDKYLAVSDNQGRVFNYAIEE